jgi:hypothetical protein
MFRLFETAIWFISMSLLVSSVEFVSGAESQTWNWRKPLPQANDLNAIAYGAETFVAVGNAGTILRQQGGAWQVVSQRSGSTFFGVTFGLDTFVIVGAGGSILTSADGNEWNERLSGTTQDLHSVKYLDGTFIAVGKEGTLLTSPDAVSWVKRESNTDLNLAGVAFGNGRFVAVGYRCGWIACFEGVVITSADSVNWEKSNSGSRAGLSSVAFGQGLFVASGNNGSDTGPDGTIYVSRDGLTWEQATNGLSSSLRVAEFANGRFFVIGGDALVSTNGVDWAVYPRPPLEPIFGLTYLNGVFLAVGWKGSILKSADAINWSPLVSPDYSYHSQVAYGNGTWLIFDGTRSWASSNAVNWRSSETTASGLRAPTSFCFGQGTFVGLSGDGTVFLSTDGLKWETMHLPELAMLDISALGFGLDRFFAAGQGILAQSSDARTWQVSLFDSGNLR